MRKPVFCICETAKLISAFVFAIRIVQFLFYLNPKCQAFNHLLRLYSPVCVGPGRKPERWFSHDAAQLMCAYENSCLDSFHKSLKWFQINFDYRKDASLKNASKVRDTVGRIRTKQGCQTLSFEKIKTD